MGGIKKWLLGALSVLTLCAVSVGASACGGENGANGKDGKDGADGKSAYQIWLDNGHTGTQADFLEWLQGDGKDGVDGTDGKDGVDGADGKDGKDGADGKSAYQIWLDNGHTGTEADFLEWLKGDGVSSAESLQYQRISGKDEYRVIGLGTVSSLDIEIPATYKGLPVTEIGASAFEEQIYLESVTISDSVTTIDSSAFGGCSMTEIVIPDSVTSIGSGAFEYCKSLTSVEIGNGVTTIGGSAFYDCSNLTEIYYNAANATCGDDVFKGAGSAGDGVTLTIGNSVKTLPDLDASATKITKVVFEEGSVCESIEYTFKNLSSLTSIEIPDSVMSIAEGAFSGCSGLTEMELPFVGAKVSVTASDTYQYPFGYIFGTDSYTGGNATRQYYYNPDESIIPPGSYSCYVPTALQRVTIAGGNIDLFAFYNCSSLTSVTISKDATIITVDGGTYAFVGCSSLTDIVVEDNNASCKSIDGNLYNKDGTTLMQYAVGKTASDFVVPDSVTSIAADAFAGCSSLTSVVIGDGVTTIATHTFYNCSNLTEIVIPDSVTSIGVRAFNNCNNLKEIKIPDNVTSIGDEAFVGCYSLTSITIGNGVTSIGRAAFFECNSLNSVAIPDSVTSIGEKAFWGCSSLTSVVIGDSVTSIGEYAFCNCSSLTSVYYKGAAEDWSTISIGTSLDSNLALYYYSKTAPALNADGTAYDGNYWHYDENGEVAVWVYAKSEE